MSRKTALYKQSIKRPNKQLVRRLEGLKSKCYQYGLLEGVELALFVSYPKKKEFYSYRSSPDLSWLLKNEPQQKSHFKSLVEYPEDVVKRMEKLASRKPRTKKSIPPLPTLILKRDIFIKKETI